MGFPLSSIGTPYGHLCNNGGTNPDTVWVVGSDRPKESKITRVQIPPLEGANAGEIIGNFCHDLCKNGLTDRFAILVVDAGGPKEEHV